MGPNSSQSGVMQHGIPRLIWVKAMGFGMSRGRHIRQALAAIDTFGH